MCMHCPFLISPLCSKVKIIQHKNADDHGKHVWQTHHKRTNRTQLFLWFWHYNTPWHQQGKVLRVAAHPAWTTFQHKHTHSIRLCLVWKFQIWMYQEEKQNHLWPCQLQSLTLSTSIEGKRQRVHFAIKSKVSLCVFLFFHPTTPQSTPLFVPS